MTDAIAFLSNASAEIETVVGFGIGAALAVLAAFVILGLTVPLAVMRLDARRSRPAGGPGSGGHPREGRGTFPRFHLAGVVVALARGRLIVLPLAAVITAVAAFYAFKLEASFDVKDFFKADSDFVVGLDKIDEYVSTSGGEPAVIYIEGDLADPSALDAIEGFLDRLAENPNVAKTDYGQATLQARPLFYILHQAVVSEYARIRIEEASGVAISTEGDLGQFEYADKVYRWPRSREELAAIYDYVAVNGVPLGPSQDIYDPFEVRETFYRDLTGVRADATSIVVGIPGTREQANVILSRDSLIREAELLATVPAISFVGLTGSPYTRQAALDATTEGLQRAFLIAIVACLVVAIVAMRSVRFGVVTIVPIGLVVAWLYAFMYAFDFGLNFITATIAAISIGVGIDFSIHFTQRFREELAVAGDRLVALERTAEGTGVALIASAATSVLGFIIMGFAPMPMFASYGILTAVMIFLAAAASLLVLPSLLLSVTPEGAEARQRE